MRRTTIAYLPVEVLLECFSFMELKSLIISRCVCAGWRELVPQAPLNARRRLLDLYYGIVNANYSLKTHDYALECLQPFDRQAYIDKIITQYPTLPDDFRFWILEWPSGVVIHSIWPGLPIRLRLASRLGVNCLGSPSAPQVSALVYHIGTPDAEFIPGIMVWKTPSVATWLILDERPHLFGRVINLESVRGRPGDEQGFEGTVVGDWNSWIEYLLVEWNRSVMNSRTEVGFPEDFTYSRKCGIRRSRRDLDISQLPWSRRHEGEFQSRLKTSWS